MYVERPMLENLQCVSQLWKSNSPLEKGCRGVKGVPGRIPGSPVVDALWHTYLCIHLFGDAGMLLFQNRKAIARTCRRTQPSYKGWEAASF